MTTVVTRSGSSVVRGNLAIVVGLTLVDSLDLAIVDRSVETYEVRAHSFSYSRRKDQVFELAGVEGRLLLVRPRRFGHGEVRFEQRQV